MYSLEYLFDFLKNRILFSFEIMKNVVCFLLNTHVEKNKFDPSYQKVPKVSIACGGTGKINWQKYKIIRKKVSFVLRSSEVSLQISQTRFHFEA